MQLATAHIYHNTPYYHIVLPKLTSLRTSGAVSHTMVHTHTHTRALA